MHIIIFKGEKKIRNDLISFLGFQLDFFLWFSSIQEFDGCYNTQLLWLTTNDSKFLPFWYFFSTILWIQIVTFHTLKHIDEIILIVDKVPPFLSLNSKFLGFFAQSHSQKIFSDFGTLLHFLRRFPWFYQFKKSIMQTFGLFFKVLEPNDPFLWLIFRWSRAFV